MTLDHCLVCMGLGGVIITANNLELFLSTFYGVAFFILSLVEMSIGAVSLGGRNDAYCL